MYCPALPYGTLVTIEAAGLSVSQVPRKAIHGEDLADFSFHILYLLKYMVIWRVLTKLLGYLVELLKVLISDCWKSQMISPTLNIVQARSPKIL